MKVKAFLRPFKDRDEAPISVWYTHNTKYFVVPVGLSAPLTRWNKKKGYVVGDDLTNLNIEKVKSELLDCAKRILLSGQEPTVNAVREVFRSKALPIVEKPVPAPSPIIKELKPKEPSVSEMMVQYLEVNKNHLSAGTIKQRKAFVKSMEDFMTAKKFNMKFSEMDEPCYTELAQYYLYDKGYYNNFFGSIIKRLKGFLKWCETEQGIAINPAWRKFKIYTEEKEIVYLTPPELSLLYNTEWEGFTKKCVDLFILACDTGFRVSDILRSRFWRIEDGIIYTTTQKTKGAAKVPVTSRILEILKRYNNDMRIVTEQKTNEAIKLCLEKIGITQNVIYRKYKLRKEFEFNAKKCDLVSMHSGRRSFISNSFAAGYTESEIMEMIGSKDAMILKVYLKIEASSLKGRRSQTETRIAV